MAFLQESHIEKADIDFFLEHLQYDDHIDAWEKKLVGRDHLKDVVLKDRLEKALVKLNPDLPQGCIKDAMEELTRSRASMTPVLANQEVYELIKEGVPTSYTHPETGREENDYVKVIDFHTPGTNEYLVVSQLSIEYLETQGITRRPDLLLYVNGVPLVMLELKNATEKVKSGYDKNLVDYKRDIPQLFWYNLFVCISNGIQTRVGSFNAEWGHFFSWTKFKDTAEDHGQMPLAEIEELSRNEQKRLSLQVFSEGLCNKASLLDYFENYVLFYKNKVKIIAKNHQFLGVNNAIQALERREGNKGKLGVFWHTQGAGKSYSMIFFTRKVHRKLVGNWSFLIVTDRIDLDDQIFRNFVDTGAVQLKDGVKLDHNPYRAKGKKSREQLEEGLKSNKSFFFTTIFNFGIQAGKTYPKLTDRDDWVVIVDEAHRTQYKTLGENMRLALPNAQYIAFTGTPLLRSELTRDWFGPYVSEYNFAQSIEDGATVPLFYKKRVPTMVNENEDLIKEAAKILDSHDLNEEQLRKLEQEYSTLLQVVRRQDRLEEIAKDIVAHFPYRLDVRDDEGNPRPMKAMVISIDKFTAVRMHDLVERYMSEEVRELRKKINRSKNHEEKERYRRALEFIRETKLAVVISQEGSDKEEREKFRVHGLEIEKHRKLIDVPDDEGQNIEDYFRDENNRYRIVFVTAMWLTGFDAPAVSTLYLDKPLSNHTLMQAIARANRVFDVKKNGLVVDYFGVFRRLKSALADYAEGSKGKDDKKDQFPVQEFEELLKLLKQGIEEAKAWCKAQGADLEEILKLGDKGFKTIGLFKDYADLILKKDENRRQLRLYVNTIVSLFDSAKPEIYDHPSIKKDRDVLEYLRKVVDRQLDSDTDLEKVKGEINTLLDESVVTQGELPEGDRGVEFVLSAGKEVDLSKLNFEKLREQFKKRKRKAIAFTDLRNFMEIKLRQMIAVNKTRGRFLEDFQKIIDEYNAGSLSLEEAYEHSTKLLEKMTDEEQRAAKMGMTDAQCELFDLLKKEKLTQKEEKAVILAAKELLVKLYDGKNRILVQEWHREKRTQEVVRMEIFKILNEHLPEKAYGREIFARKSEEIYRHFYEKAEKGSGFAA